MEPQRLQIDADTTTYSNRWMMPKEYLIRSFHTKALWRTVIEFFPHPFDLLIWFLNRHCPEYEEGLSQPQRPVVNHYVGSAELVSDSKEIRYFIRTKFGLTY